MAEGLCLAHIHDAKEAYFDTYERGDDDTKHWIETEIDKGQTIVEVGKDILLRERKKGNRLAK